MNKDTFSQPSDLARSNRGGVGWGGGFAKTKNVELAENALQCLV